MNREILFRGKDLETGEWRHGSLGYSDNKTRAWISWEAPKAQDVGYFTYEVDPDTVGQYTGLEDANDTKIFEGDIIKQRDKIWTVKWNHSAWYKWVENDSENGGVYLHIHEQIDKRTTVVIGNVHQTDFITDESHND